jgi:hypothetical protein
VSPQRHNNRKNRLIQAYGILTENIDLSGETGGAGEYHKKTEISKLGEFLRLFSQPQVRSRVIAIQELFQEAQAMA